MRDMAFQYCEPSDFSDFTPYSTIEVAVSQIKDESVKAEMLRAIEEQKEWNRQNGLSKQEKQAVIDCISDMLWVAKIWNDHNFGPEAIQAKAKRLSEYLDIDTVREANDFFAKLKAALDR